MKKNTRKKAKTKVASKAKPAPRKSSASSGARGASLAKSRTTAVMARPSQNAVAPKTAKQAPTRKISENAPAARGLRAKTSSKDVSGNGKALAVNDRKTRKEIEHEAPEARKPEPQPPPPPPVKTYLSAKELKEFKAMLLEKRAELAGDVERLTSEALNRKSGGVNEQSTMPIHMADLGTDTWEQDFTLGLIANEQALVREIDDALARIEDKTYGMCVATDKPISKERLRAKPWAKYCIEYARLREEGRAP